MAHNHGLLLVDAISFAATGGDALAWSVAVVSTGPIRSSSAAATTSRIRRASDGTA